MVGPGDLPPYKHLGDESPVPSPEGLQGLSHQPESNGNVRQFHGGSLCLQTGRNSLGLPLRVDRATSPLDGRQQCPPRSEVPPRTIEHPCGSAQPPQPGPGGGVVSSPTSGEEDHPHMVIPDHRPIRDTSEREIAPVLPSDPRPSGPLRGCLLTPMEPPRRVRVPTVRTGRPHRPT